MTSPRKPEDPRRSPYIYVTWMLPILSGAAQCLWRAHHQTHFFPAKLPSTFNLAQWQAEHTAMLRRRVETLRAEGWSVRVEDENHFHWRGKRITVTVAGKPDYIADRGDEILIGDTKTGEQKNDHWWQLLVYMFAAPDVWKERMADKQIRGEVVYLGANGEDVVVPVPFTDLTTDRKAEIVRVIERLARSDAPTQVPSPSECGKCELAACTARAKPVEAVEASAF